jgi:hypothetical protein
VDRAHSNQMDLVNQLLSNWRTEERRMEIRFNDISRRLDETRDLTMQILQSHSAANLEKRSTVGELRGVDMFDDSGAPVARAGHGWSISIPSSPMSEPPFRLLPRVSQGFYRLYNRSNVTLLDTYFPPEVIIEPSGQIHLAQGGHMRKRSTGRWDSELKKRISELVTGSQWRFSLTEAEEFAEQILDALRSQSR